MEVMLEAIQTLGFPAAICIFMAWYIKYITDKYQTQLDSINKAHLEESTGVMEAINRNTVALTELTALIKIERGLGDDEGRA